MISGFTTINLWSILFSNSILNLFYLNTSNYRSYVFHFEKIEANFYLKNQLNCQNLYK